VVIERLEALGDSTLGEDKAIAAFRELMHSVATVKERHGRHACRPKRR
jgi:hypothetical protein